jgi:hypothetical protein
MKKLVTASIIPIFLCALAQCSQGSLLLIDTGNNDPYNYHTLMENLRSLGIKTTFKHFYELKPIDIDNYDAIWMVVDASFYAATHRDLTEFQTINNPVLKHVNELLEALSKQKNKSIGLILPVCSSPVLIRSITEQLCNKLSVIDRSTTEKNKFFAVLNHLLQSDGKKSYRYATALLPTRENSFNKEKLVIGKNGDDILQVLPNNISIQPELAPLLPLAMHIRNKTTGNNFFITTINILNNVEIQEPICLTPMQQMLRTQLSDAIKNTLAQAIEFSHLAMQKNETFSSIIKPTKKEILAERNQALPAHSWLKEPVVCGWMELEPYYGKEAQAIKDIEDAGINLMWFELNPEWYLADNALRKEQKEKFLKQIADFTFALKKHQEKTGKPLPRFFVGTDITSNFAHTQPTDPARDFYGFTYENIPNPLDYEQFWKPELLTVFDRFVDEWEKNIGNGIPLSGVFLDMEMYHAQKQTGQFHSTMDFSTTAWNTFALKKNDPKIKDLNSINERVSYLQKNNLMPEYFEQLRNRAVQIGKDIKLHIKKRLPDAHIALYNINLPHSWFYQGFSKGLSSAEEPIIYATFNSEFLKHYPQLAKQDIHLVHMPVMLLSKFQNVHDFELISDIVKDHDGIWYNRFSRISQSRAKKDWGWDWALETTRLDTEIIVKNCAKQMQKMHENNSTK